MKCARCFAPRDVRVVDSPDPIAGPGEILVAVRAVSLCPSDLHIYREGHASGVYPDHPMVLGHEFSGVVAALGAGVDGPPAGTRVAIEPAWHCGTCDVCQRGLTNICRNVIFPSYPNHDGALAELIACPAFSVYPIPDEVSFIEAALAEPLGVSVHACRLARPEAGESAAILGAGAIGTSVLELVRHAGVTEAYVVEPNESRWETPKRLGATAVYGSARELIDEVGGTERGPRLVFDASSGQHSLGEALELCEPAGRVMVISIPPKNHAHFEPSTPRRKELAIQYTRRSRETMHEAIDLVASGRTQVDSYPRLEFTLAETAHAFESAENPPGGVLRSVVLIGD